MDENCIKWLTQSNLYGRWNHVSRQLETMDSQIDQVRKVPTIHKHASLTLERTGNCQRPRKSKNIPFKIITSINIYIYVCTN